MCSKSESNHDENESGLERERANPLISNHLFIYTIIQSSNLKAQNRSTLIY